MTYSNPKICNFDTENWYQCFDETSKSWTENLWYNTHS